MSQSKLIGLLSLLFVLIVAGCSNQKDGFSYRVFHNTTAKYNGFFYAKESLKEVHSVLDENHIENYDKILPLFIYGEEGSEDALNNQTERIIEKTQKVITLHNMDVSRSQTKKMKRPEMNKWIDNNYLLLGQGYFYKKNYFKAEEFFKFITRKYDDDNILAQANTWLARIYIEKKQYTKAINTLNTAGKKGDLDNEVVAETNMVFADLYIRKGDYKMAVEKLQKAISHIEKKKQRARPTFILAQLNQELGNSEQAITLYKEVVKMKPEYELVFYSKINQAMAFRRRDGNSNEIRETLFKMLKDEKNLEYNDQIYYALAELALEERDQDSAIDYLEKSVKANVGNQKQKAKSFLRLADLYFEDRMYSEAQAYYDSTATNLDKEHPRYDKVLNMAESLTELVTNLETISREDSLNSLCELSLDDRLERLKEIRKGMEADMEEQRRADEQAALDALQNSADDNSGTGLFWPYNSYLKEVGRNNFVDYWGERKLEDNWRRSNRSPSFSDGNDGRPEEATEEYISDSKYDVPSVEELLASLPCSSEQKMISDSLVAAAYYNNGLIYKEKLDDFENGIDSWETLVTNEQESSYHPTAYYQLYRSFYKKEQEGYTNFGCTTCSSRYWADIISQNYPGSEWDYLVKDPNYLVGKSLIERQEQEKYTEIYKLYASYKYVDVVTQAGEIIESEPENHLLCKYRLLKAQAIGNLDGLTGQRENYLQELQNVIKKCPDSDEAVTARGILDALKGNKIADRGDKKEDDKKGEEDKKEEVPDGLFSYEPMVKHYMAIVVPSEGDLPIPVGEMKINISDYNKNNHQSLNLKVTSNLFGREYHIILVKTLANIEEGNNYMDSFVSNNDLLKEINESDFKIMLISKTNYLTIFKERNLEDYFTFYDDNY